MLINFLLLIKYCEAQEGESQEELASRETINTPAITTTQTGKKQYCNFNQNDELLISIIFQHIDILFSLLQFTPLQNCLHVLLNNVQEV